MTRLFLVRHGPTHAKEMVGWTDLPADLSDIAALNRLNAYLPKNALIVSSDLTRAIETASAIQGTRSRLSHAKGLREIHFGAWEMLKFDEVKDQSHIRAFWEQPGDIRAPNGESWNDTCTRVSKAVDQLIEQHPNNDLILVAHFGAILTQVQRATGLSGYETFSNHIDNLSLTTLKRQQGNWMVETINHIP